MLISLVLCPAFLSKFFVANKELTHLWVQQTVWANQVCTHPTDPAMSQQSMCTVLATPVGRNLGWILSQPLINQNFLALTMASFSFIFHLHINQLVGQSLEELLGVVFKIRPMTGLISKETEVYPTTERVYLMWRCWYGLRLRVNPNCRQMLEERYLNNHGTYETSRSLCR